MLCSTLTLHFPVFPWTGDLKKLGDIHHGPKIVLISHSNSYVLLSKGMSVVVMRSDLFVSLFNFDKQAKLDSAIREFNVCQAEKRTKRSSVLLLCLVCFSV